MLQSLGSLPISLRFAGAGDIWFLVTHLSFADSMFPAFSISFEPCDCES